MPGPEDRDRSPQNRIDSNRNDGAVLSSSYPDVLPDKFFRMKFFKYKRLGTSGRDTSIKPTATINLPIPSNLIDVYNASFQGTNLGVVGGVVYDVGDATMSLIDNLRNSQDLTDAGRRVINSLGDTINSARTSISAGAFQDILQILSLRLADTAGNFLIPGGGTAFRTAAELLMGKIENPRTVSAFQGMNLRNHTLNWILAPRNQSESNSIEDIISLMRYYMHPDLGATSYMLTYPDQVEMEVVGVEKNTYFYKTSVLAHLNVDRTAAGIPAFFKQTGAPLMYRISTTFAETETLTRRDLDRTYTVSTSSSSNSNGDRSL